MSADIDTFTLDWDVDEPAPVGTSRETTLDTPVTGDPAYLPHAVKQARTPRWIHWPVKGPVNVNRGSW